MKDTQKRYRRLIGTQTRYNAENFVETDTSPQEKGSARWHALFWDLELHIARS